MCNNNGSRASTELRGLARLRQTEVGNGAPSPAGKDGGKCCSRANPDQKNEDHLDFSPFFNCKGLKLKAGETDLAKHGDE